MLCDDRGMPFEKMEGIRLGAVKYDINTNKIYSFDRYIKPINRASLSSFCKDLTGIEDADLEKADDFKHVFTDFLTWVGGVKKSRFFSWSPSDINRLKIDAEMHKISQQTIKKIESRYIDFQAVFTNRMTKTNYSVENALKLYGLPFLGEKHNPMCDAYNTLRIYLCFLNERVESDLLMVKHFITETVPVRIQDLNSYILEQLNQDIKIYFSQFQEVYRLKDFHKKINIMRKLVQKYENILYNRSKIFSRDLLDGIHWLKQIYEELAVSYEEHMKYYSKIMILDENLVKPLKQFAMK